MLQKEKQGAKERLKGKTLNLGHKDTKQRGKKA